MNRHEKFWNALLVVILAGVLTSAYVFQFTLHEEPCPLCMLQRLGMIGITLGALMNLKFGIRTAHYGFSIISAMMGGAVSTRQFLLHVCPDYSTFGSPVMGLRLYTWAFVVFACALAYIAFLMISFEKREKEKEVTRLTPFGLFAFFYIFIICSANVITTLIQCGLSVC